MSTRAEEINKILEPHLFQVIGSTPQSIRDSLKKVDLKGDSEKGAYLITVAVFAAAVNKATLETFLSKPQFAAVRPMIGIALAIQGKTNMTAFTLLGHCLMTSKLADNIVFIQEFRKKMGQETIWAGNLESGSLSDKQKTILKEKKRVTELKAAECLGRGFIKWTGLDTNAFTPDEAEFWGVSTGRSTTTGRSNSRETTFPGADAGLSSSTGIPRRRVSPPGSVSFQGSNDVTYDIPDDVFHYRKTILRHTDSDINDSIRRNGIDKFIDNTRRLMRDDPDGNKTLRAGSTTG